MIDLNDLLGFLLVSGALDDDFPSDEKEEDEDEDF